MTNSTWRCNIEDGPWVEQKHGERFQVFRKPLSAIAGGKAIGASLYRLPPGKSAFPHHAHLGNEEAIFVLAGRGALRLGEVSHTVRAGDYIPLPRGPEFAHSFTNSGEGDLDYLAISTMNEPDAILYPDSGKVGVMAGSAPGGDKSARTLTAFFENRPVDYWQGEGE